jgi:uncharacterized protein
MRTSLLAALVVSSALASPAAAQQPTVPLQPMMPPPPTIAVLGRGEEKVTPDRARLMLGVQTQASTAALAASQNAKIQRAVLDTLRAMGIGADQVSTSGYNVYPEQQHDQQTRRARIVGYNVQNTVVVELRKIDQVGPALDAALTKGANNVASLSFYYSEAAAAQRKALAKAVEAARAEAEVIATAAGGRLGELFELSSIPQTEGPRPVMAMAQAKMASDAIETPISEGTQTVVGLVSARWRFVSGR